MFKTGKSLFFECFFEFVVESIENGNQWIFLNPEVQFFLDSNLVHPGSFCYMSVVSEIFGHFPLEILFEPFKSLAIGAVIVVSILL